MKSKIIIVPILTCLSLSGCYAANISESPSLSPFQSKPSISTFTRTNSPSPIAASTASSTPTITPTITLTMTPTAEPVFVTPKFGPVDCVTNPLWGSRHKHPGDYFWKNYLYLGTLLPGEKDQPIGRWNKDSWWLIHIPIRGNEPTSNKLMPYQSTRITATLTPETFEKACWVSNEAVNVVGDTSTVPTFTCYEIKDVGRRTIEVSCVPNTY